MSQIKQLIEGATDGMMPSVANRIQKTVLAAYWLGVDDGRRYELGELWDSSLSDEIAKREGQGSDNP